MKRKPPTNAVGDLEVGDVPATTQEQVDYARAMVNRFAIDPEAARTHMSQLGVLPEQIAAQPHLYEPGVK